MWVLVLLCVVNIRISFATVKQLELMRKPVFIGGIFPPDSAAEVAFTATLSRISMHADHNYKFMPIISHARYGDSYAVEAAVCNLTTEGVIAIYGPLDIVSAAAVESRSRSLGIPHIQGVWRPPPLRGSIQPSVQSINIYPEAIALSKAIANFIEDNDWKTFILLYDDDFGLIRLQEILKHAQKKQTWKARRLVPGDDNRSLLKSLYETGENHVILDCPAERVRDYLLQAKEVQFFQDYQTYILTSLDAHTLDLADLQYGLANVTCFRIIDPENARTRSYLDDWRSIAKPEMNMPNSAERITVEVALASDAAWLIADAVRQNKDVLDLTAKQISCDSEDKWEIGQEFNEHLLTNPVDGVTGMIEINSNGDRTNFNVEIMELSNSGFSLIAKWGASGFTYTRSESEVSDLLAERWQNKTFRVVSRIGAPYLVEVKPEEGEEIVGNDRYEGYSKDLIHEILKGQLNLNYELEIVPDNKYGSFNKETKKWDGLVKHLMDRKADLAICDLTITYERRSVVDFTTPFMTLGISILYSKPEKAKPELFSFLKPFSIDVWVYMATAYIFVSLWLCVLARIAPKDWENPHPCDKNPEELENIWSVKNSCWLTMGSIMTQGSDLLPKGYSTRWVAGLWWFFALIMCSSYTANLAAFLTAAAMEDTINGAEDLAMQTKIKYGAVLGGSTGGFFKNSKVSIYQRMWAAMEATRPSVFCKNNDEGVERVLKGKRQYAFLMESSAIEYQLERNCDLMQVGGLLDSKGYGIAMPFDSSYRTAVDNALLKLAESGKLSELKTKWWKVPEEEACVEEDTSADSGELGVDNVGGVFFILGIGCGIAAGVASLEFLWHIQEVAKEQKMTQTEALWAELKFALSFWETEKPAKHSRPSSSASNSDVASRASSVLRSAADLFHLDFLNKN